METSWQMLKYILSSKPVLQYYNPQKLIRISADASKDGLGAVILQLHDDQWKPISYASRAMLDAETRYAQIEKELLSIAYACERFHQFIFGTKIQIETDHKPLVSIFKKSLADCPLRIQRLLLKLQRYDLDVTYTPGKYLVSADALSRATDKTAVATLITAEQVDLHVNMVLQTMPISDRRMEQLRQETIKDECLCSLKEMILKGWPQSKELCPSNVTEYWNVRQELSTANDIILKGSKIVIPKILRREMLSKIHEGHLGIEKCRRRGREVMFWPGMNADIMQMVQSCSACLTYMPKHSPEPLKPHDVPVYPWQKVGTDLFTCDNKNYLLVTDYFSLYPEVVSLTNTTSKTIIGAMKSVFARHGTPNIVISDNGPQYSSSEFKAFSIEWDFEHVTSSPHYPQSNGFIESSVKTVKRILYKTISKNEDIFKALQAYRATPALNDASPAQLLMGRRIRTTLPIHPSLLKITSSDQHVQSKLAMKQKQKDYYDRRTHELQNLHTGDRIRLFDYSSNKWLHGGNIVNEVSPRSYNIETDNGTQLRRNRRDIRKFGDSPANTIEVYDLPNSDDVVTIVESHPMSGSYGADGEVTRRSTRNARPPTRLIESC